MTCMFDRDEQCFGECSNCARHEEPECCNCGTAQKLVTYDGEKYCPECLAEKLVADVDSVVSEFIDEHFDLFVKHVASVC